MSALAEGGFEPRPASGDPPTDYPKDDRTIFRPLRPIMEYDARSDRTDFGSGLSYEAEPEPSIIDGEPSPVLGVSAIVLLASASRAHRPSSK